MLLHKADDLSSQTLYYFYTQCTESPSWKDLCSPIMRAIEPIVARLTQMVEFCFLHCIATMQANSNPRSSLLECPSQDLQTEETDQS